MIRAAEKQSPDLIIADLEMTGLDGIEATARLRSICENVPVIILASEGAPEFIDEAFDAGASAYVLKRDAAEDLMMAIRRTLDGERFVSRSCRNCR